MRPAEALAQTPWPAGEDMPHVPPPTDSAAMDADALVLPLRLA